jgi:hypothetical protein
VKVAALWFDKLLILFLEKVMGVPSKRNRRSPSSGLIVLRNG